MGFLKLGLIEILISLCSVKLYQSTKDCLTRVEHVEGRTTTTDCGISISESTTPEFAILTTKELLLAFERIRSELSRNRALV